MTAIYTKTGDDGSTGLFGGGRVPKDDPRVESYGEVDELNAALGFALALASPADGELARWLTDIQNQLFTVGSVLATPPESKAASALPALDPSWAARFEAAIDAFDSELPPLREFILPGGTALASALHLGRTVCRRAERRVVALVREGKVTPLAVVYLNRLSDFLFVLARVANRRAQVADVAWRKP